MAQADLAYSFDAELIYWRGPAPFVFAALPDDVSTRIAAIAGQVSYGWGCIAVCADIGGIPFTTAIIPKDGLYLLPLKAAVRKQLPPLETGERVHVEMHIVAPANSH